MYRFNLLRIILRIIGARILKEFLESKIISIIAIIVNHYLTLLQQGLGTFITITLIDNVADIFVAKSVHAANVAQYYGIIFVY